MSLVPSLLQAIVQVDGEALVMHAGDKPYVVDARRPGGPRQRGLTLEAVNGIVSQLLPPEVLQRARRVWRRAVPSCRPRPEFPQEQFTVVAARGGDDVWAEIRRRQVPDDDRVPEDLFGPAATAGNVRIAAHEPTADARCGLASVMPARPSTAGADDMMTAATTRPEPPRRRPARTAGRRGR